MAKRGENIYQRKDGRWEGRFIKSRRPDGKPTYGYVYAKKYRACKDKLEEAKSKHRYVPERGKRCGSGAVCDFLNHWLYHIVKPYVKVSTFSNYAAIAEKWLLPGFGKQKLREVGREDVQHFISSLEGRELAPGTIRNIYRVFYAGMKKAVEYGYLAGNPCEGVHLPKEAHKEARLLTLKEQKRLEQAAKGDKNGTAILLANYTGLRVGEICALTWSDIDLQKGVLTVSKSLRRVPAPNGQAGRKTTLVVGGVKSSRSERAIPLPSCMVELLLAHQKTAASDYVFSYKGHPLEPRILQYRFKALLKKAGIADINFHALRHTFATRCMELCFDIKTLSELLGHASAKLTLDRYGHSQMEHKRSAMNTLDGLYTMSA